MPLIIGRRLGESIVIGDEPAQITIKIHELTKGKVRLAIDAPKEVRVLRTELLRENHNGKSCTAEASNHHQQEDHCKEDG